MQTINRFDYDEEGIKRYSGTNFISNGITNQIDSYCFSYLNARKEYQRLGLIMGLDNKCNLVKKCNNINDKHFSYCKTNFKNCEIYNLL